MMVQQIRRKPHLFMNPTIIELEGRLIRGSMILEDFLINSWGPGAGARGGGRLIRGSAYTRVYTVIFFCIFLICGLGNYRYRRKLKLF